MNEWLEKFPPAWQKFWTENGFKEPSLIQKAVFEQLQQKESLVGISPTGSGKTLAYLLPLLLNIEKGEASKLLVLTSSQELAVQVADVARKWAKEVGLSVQAIVGGGNVKRQVEGLKKKPEILVGTPGRVLELMKSRKLKAHQIQTIVLDEADQLFDGSSVTLIEQILKQAPVDYQLAFFSATADRSIEEIQKVTNQHYPVIDVTESDESRKQLRHFYLQVPARKKEEYLRRLAQVEGFQSLVFFNQLSELGAAEEKLSYRGISVGSLASDQNKLVRQAALTNFREGKITELLTTDVAARGLDIDALRYVVNAEVPLSPESYLHRSGRTGRMGNEGSVITFVQDHTFKDLKRIARDAKISLEEIFIYGGELLTELPEKEPMKNGLPAQKKPTPSKPKAPQNTPADAEKPKPKKHKKKRKNEKNKGARRK
jgi:superfamily II DNA/RNA helicase